MPLQRSGADFGALQVLPYADGSSFCRGNLAQSLNAADVVLGRSMRKIQTRNIHASLHELAQRRFRSAGGADGANDFGPACRIFRRTQRPGAWWILAHESLGYCNRMAY